MPERWRRIGLALGWALVGALAPLSVAYAYVTRVPGGGDFGMYYAAAEALRYAPHSAIYLTQSLDATVRAHGGCGSATLDPYPYQPLLALLLAPQTNFPCQSVELVWFWLNIALWLGMTVAYTARSWRRNGSGQALLVALMALLFQPIILGITWGQIHLLILVSMLAGMWLVARRWEYAGGAVLAVGAVLKYLPAFLVVYYLLRGRWKVALGAAITALALTATQTLIVGPQTMLASIGASAADIRYYANLNDGGDWMRALPGGVVIAYLASGVFVIVVVWLQWRKHTTNMRLGASWSIVAALMLTPLLWWYYLTWALPALLASLESIGLALKAYPLARRATYAGLALSYILLDTTPFHLPPPVFRISAIGTLLLWLLCGALYTWSARLSSRLQPLARGSSYA